MSDLIRDFIIGAYGKPNPIAEENLRRLAKKITACQGEFLLLIRRYEDCCLKMATGLMPNPDFTFIKTTLFLGIINGQLCFGAPSSRIIFPVQSPYAVVWKELEEPRLLEGDIMALNFFLGYEILQLLKQPEPTTNMDCAGIEMAVGDQEIMDFIRQYQNAIQKHYGELPLLMPFYKMCILLGRYLHDFPEQTAAIEKDPAPFRAAHKKL